MRDAPGGLSSATMVRGEVSARPLVPCCGREAPLQDYAPSELPTGVMAQRGPARRMVPDVIEAPR